MQRGHIDLLHRTVHVQREAHEITGQGRILTPPKSEAGGRAPKLPVEIRDELSDHLDGYVAPNLTRTCGTERDRANAGTVSLCREGRSEPVDIRGDVLFTYSAVGHIA